MSLDALAVDLLSVFGTGAVSELPTKRFPGFSLSDAYDVAHQVRALREARGERVVGRKIGGTNPSLYHLTGATGPAWGFMYDTTVRSAASATEMPVSSFPLARIEPEIVFRIARTPEPGMAELDVLRCIDAVAVGFEFVFSPFGIWPVPPADAVAGFCLHCGARVGCWQQIDGDDPDIWRERLRMLQLRIRSDEGIERSGIGASVFGSPLRALKSILDQQAANPGWHAILPGEIVTTGTVTELLPIAVGQTWTVEVSGAPLEGIEVKIVS